MVLVQICNCIDYLYVNDLILDIMYKFIVSFIMGGVVGEVDVLNWLLLGDIFNVYGVVGDINGNFYIVQLVEILLDGLIIFD